MVVGSVCVCDGCVYVRACVRVCVRACVFDGLSFKIPGFGYLVRMSCFVLRGWVWYVHV